MKTLLILTLSTLLMETLALPTRTTTEQVVIEKQIRQVFEGADARDWNKIEKVLAPAVRVDYTSLAGGKPAKVTPTELTKSWQALLPGFERTQHTIGKFEINITGTQATAQFQGRAAHFLHNEKWVVIGTYQYHLTNIDGQWLTDEITFSLVRQEGNMLLPSQAMERVKLASVQTRKVEFLSEGLVLKGNLFLPARFDARQQYPTIIVTGSWTSIKEQMAGLYAQNLAEKGFVTLAFDFRYWGESEGMPRQYENPSAKIVDIQHAVTYLLSQPFVDAETLTVLGICASAGYVAHAAAEDARIKKVVTVAAWLHNKPVAEAIYNNWPEKYEGLIAKGKAAADKFAKTGETDFVPACSDTDPNAAMYVPNGIFPYYIDKSLGAIDAYTNRFATMSWPQWLQFDGVAAGKKISQPLYMVHSAQAALPDGAKTFYASAAGEKQIVWLDEFNQMEFYYKKTAVTAAVNQVSQWLLN